MQMLATKPQSSTRASISSHCHSAIPQLPGVSLNTEITSHPKSGEKNLIKQSFMWPLMTRDIPNSSVIFRVGLPKLSARVLGLVYTFDVTAAYI